MASTPQHNMRFPAELWEKIEEVARSRESIYIPYYPRTWVVSQIIREHFERESSIPDNKNGSNDSKNSANNTNHTN